MDFNTAFPADFWAFIKTHLNEDTRALALRFSKKNMGFDLNFALVQIKARQKAKSKMPTWAAADRLLFPNLLAVEQASSELAALWKTEGLGKQNLCIDLTGGLGLDAWAFSRFFEEVYYVEQNAGLVAAASHNFGCLGITNITCFHAEAGVFLDRLERPSDLIFIDPARRGKGGQKVVYLSDCSPDVPVLLPQLKAKTKRLLLKTSPMLDIQKGLEDLGGQGETTVLSIDNEVKELLFELDFSEKTSNPKILAVDIQKGGAVQTFQFTKEDESNANTAYEMPKKWIYEPNAALLKAGAFRSVAHRFGLSKLHPNTHIYTSDNRLVGFPGRVFSLEKLCKYEKKEIQNALTEGKARISSRNFPHSPQQMQEKLSIKEGGNRQLIGVRLLDDKPYVLIVKNAENP